MNPRNEASAEQTKEIADSVRKTMQTQFDSIQNAFSTTQAEINQLKILLNAKNDTIQSLQKQLKAPKIPFGSPPKGDPIRDEDHR